MLGCRHRRSLHPDGTTGGTGRLDVMGFAMDARKRPGTDFPAGILERDPRQNRDAANGVRRYLAIGVESGPFEARPIERNGPRDVLEQGRQLKALVCEHLIG